jgi:hypothetical protein
MKNEDIMLLLFCATFLVTAEAGLIPSLKTKLQIIEGIISEETRRNLVEILVCQERKEYQMAVVMASKLPDSPTVTVTNILQDISSSQPVVLSHHTHSQVSFRGSCENEQVCRPIGKATVFVVFVDGNKTNEVSKILKMLKQMVHWNSRAQFIFILFRAYKNLEKILSLIFRICWRDQIFNVLLFDIQTETRLTTLKNISAYLYSPFSQYTKTTTMIPLSFNSHENSVCKYNRQSLFFDRLRDLNGYSLRVSMFDQPPKSIMKIREDNKTYSIEGEDGMLLSALAKHMNITPIVTTPKDNLDMGFRRSDGIVTGSTGDVVYNRADISFNSRFLRSDYITDVEFTYPHDKEGFCIIVSKAEKIPEYLGLVLPFSSDLWLACAIYIIVTAAFWYVSKLKMTGTASFTHVLINTFAVFLGVPLGHRTFQKYGRAVFFTWMYSSMVLTTIYRSSLITSVVTPQFYKDINTLQEFDESGLRLVMFPGIKESALLYSLNPLRVSLNKKTIITTHNFSTCIQNLLRYKDRGCACNKLSAQWTVRQEEYFSNGVPQLHLAQECLSWYAEAYEVRRGSPFLPYFNLVISRTIESGLFRKWRDDAHSTVTAKERSKFQASDQKVTLKLLHFQAAFFSLIIGLLCSISVFLWEIWLSVFPNRHFKKENLQA